MFFPTNYLPHGAPEPTRRDTALTDWAEILLGVLVLASVYAVIILRMLEKAGGVSVRKIHVTDAPMPATPEPNYVCKNCGMLVKTGHKHTRSECAKYKADPNPDRTLLRNLCEDQPARNSPKIQLPFYYPEEASP